MSQPNHNHRQTLVKIAYREALQASATNPCPRRTVIPPNRLEAGIWDLIATLIRPQTRDSLAELRASLQRHLGQDQIYLAPSARCAIAQVLSLLPLGEVVMPAFNCEVVKSAVEAAGRRIIYVDIAKGSVNATAAEFATAAQPGRILLATHQFGVPTDIESICELGKERSCVVIEDAACSFGAARNGRPLGTFGDFGIYSFENWKRLPAFRGGAISVNNSNHFDPARLETELFVKTTSKLPIRELVSALGRNVFTIPWLYGRLVLPILMQNYFRQSVDAGGGGRRSITSGAPFTRAVHPYQAQLILRMLGRLDRIRGHIQQLATVYAEAFRNGVVTTFLPSSFDAAGLLRFPVAFPGKSRAEALRNALRRGLYLETEFEQPMPPSAECARFPNAVWMCRNLVLLPLYRSLSAQNAAWLARQVNEVAHEGPQTRTGRLLSFGP